MEAVKIEALLERFIRDALHEHPLPWTVDLDWTVEVHDASGNVVLRFMTTAEAEDLIARGRRVAAQIARESEEIEAMLGEEI